MSYFPVLRVLFTDLSNLPVPGVSTADRTRTVTQPEMFVHRQLPHFKGLIQKSLQLKAHLGSSPVSDPSRLLRDARLSSSDVRAGAPRPAWPLPFLLLPLLVAALLLRFAFNSLPLLFFRSLKSPPLLFFRSSPVEL